MNLSQQKATDIAVDRAKSGSEHTAAVLILLNNARDDQRRNDAEVFSNRLEVLASYVVKHDMTTAEAVEALRVEAERIRNAAGEIH
ncbi:DUF2732 family protein [Ewingella sp. S1.OA.A_B6]